MNKLAVITGASSGIGLEFAKILAKQDYDLLLCSRDKNQLSKIAKKLQKNYSVTVDYLALDLSRQESALKLWGNTNNKKVDVFINNAGFGDLNNVIQADMDKLESMIDLNIKSLTTLSKLAAEHMVENGEGKILNVASIAAFVPGPKMAVYYASKAYVLSFSEALSEELRDSGVSITVFCPGPTKTHFAEAANADKSSLFTGKIPTAKEVAEYGIKSMDKNKVIAVHGLKNKVLVFLPRLLPRKTIRRIVLSTQK